MNTKVNVPNLSNNHMCYMDIKLPADAVINSYAFDPSGTYFAITGNDRKIRFYLVETLLKQNYTVYTQTNIEGDQPILCSFTHDGGHLITNIKDAKSLLVLKLFKEKNEEGKLTKIIKTFPHKHKTAINTIITTPRDYVITCSNDTTIMIRNLNGDILSTVDTKMMSNYMLTVSPDGQSFSVATFMNDVKIWKIITESSGLFSGVDKSDAQLKGHKSAVNCVTLIGNKAITTSKDTSWKIWEINEKKNEVLIKKSGDNPKAVPYELHAVTPDIKVVATASNISRIDFWDIEAAKILETVETSHFDKISKMEWSKDGKLLATVSNDKAIRFWKNPLNKS